MSTEERDNWEKVKIALEEADKTDCYFYKRAVAICKGGEDPLQYNSDLPIDNG
tara:strand:- start:833 stop:991 length:159 start_codon:yes stop_codon:yes gene_type:complete